MNPNQENILIVDDDESIRTLISETIALYGYRALSVESVREAFETITKEHVDLMLLDLHMPGVYGQELLRLLREYGSDLPIIIISGYVETLLEEDLREMASAILRKPFSIDELMDEIDRTLWDKE